MRRLPDLNRVICALVMMAALRGPGPLAQEAPLTLSAAVRFGLAHNPTLAAVRAEAGASAADLKTARAARWPRLLADAAWHRTDNPVTVFGDKLTAAEFAAADFALDSLNHPDPISHTIAALVVEVPLDASRRIGSGIEAASQASLSVRARLHAAEAGLVLEITEAYHGVSLAAAAVEVAEGALRSTTGHERVAQARYENGAALKSDVLRVRVHRLTRERDAERARADLELARARLRLLLGLEAGEPLVVPSAEMTPPPAGLGDLKDWGVAAPAERPEVEAARRAALAVGAQGRAERASWGPDLTATARYERNSGGLDAGEASFFAGIGIRWTAFDRGRAARIEAARERATAAQEWSRAVEDRARFEVEQAFRDAEVADFSLRTARQAVAAAEEARRITSERYASGLLPLTDLLEAETALLQARLAEIAALHEAVVGRVRLERAAGRLEVPR